MTKGQELVAQAYDLCLGLMKLVGGPIGGPDREVEHLEEDAFFLGVWLKSGELFDEQMPELYRKKMRGDSTEFVIKPPNSDKESKAIGVALAQRFRQAGFKVRHVETEQSPGPCFHVRW